MLRIRFRGVRGIDSRSLDRSREPAGLWAPSFCSVLCAFPWLPQRALPALFSALVVFSPIRVALCHRGGYPHVERWPQLPMAHGNNMTVTSSVATLLSPSSSSAWKSVPDTVWKAPTVYPEEDIQKWPPFNVAEDTAMCLNSTSLPRSQSTIHFEASAHNANIGKISVKLTQVLNHVKWTSQILRISPRVMHGEKRKGYVSDWNKSQPNALTEKKKKLGRWSIIVGFCYCSSVAKSCLTFWDPMDCSTPGIPAFTISQSLLKLMSIV